jgi:hypothetical protein
MSPIVGPIIFFRFFNQVRVGFSTILGVAFAEFEAIVLWPTKLDGS